MNARTTERARQLLLGHAARQPGAVAVDRGPRARAAWRTAANLTASRLSADRDAARRARAALAAVDRGDVERDLEDEWREIEGRRLARGHTRNAGIPHRCGSCKRFVTSVSHRCPHCGYDPDTGWLG